MGDLDRQTAVEQAARLCVVPVALLILATLTVAALTWSSAATPVLAGLLVRYGVGLVLDWGARE